MGIGGGLRDYLIQKNQGFINKVRLSKFRGKTVAVDLLNIASRMVYRSKSIMDFRNELINFIHKFQREGIRLIWVFDGKPRTEKNMVINHRKNMRAKANKQLQEIIDDISNDSADFVEEAESADSVVEPVEPVEPVVELAELVEQVEDPETIDKIAILSKRIRAITVEHIELAKSVFDTLGIYYIHIKDMEADIILKHLLDCKFADVVFSGDMDTLAYGCKHIIQDLDFRNDLITEILYEDMLHSLGVSREQFLNALILSGTDYNRHLKYSRFADNLEFIKKYGTIPKVLENLDQINLHVLDESKKISIPLRFDWQLSLEIFTEVLDPEIIKNIRDTLEQQRIARTRITNKMLVAFHTVIMEHDESPNKKYVKKLEDYFNWAYNLTFQKPKNTSSSVRRKLFT